MLLPSSVEMLALYFAALQSGLYIVPINSDDPTVVSMPVGQIVGRMNAVRPVAELFAEIVAECEQTIERLHALRK